MTYKNWQKSFTCKRDTIFNKLSNCTNEEVVNYFVFENMLKKEPNFCLLYKDKKKCHDIKYLNCFCCACPYFKFDDNGLRRENNIIIKSECTIKSKFAGKFVHENVEHLDCSACKIPHNKKFALKFMKDKY